MDFFFKNDFVITTSSHINYKEKNITLVNKNVKVLYK